jgi:cytochrome c oxidase subunit 2
LVEPQVGSCRADFQQVKEFMRRSYLAFVLTFLIAGSYELLSKARAEAVPRHVEVTAKRFAFEPTEITLKKGEPVDLVLKSTDVPHGLRFRELNVEVKVGKGGTSDVRFTPSQTGTFVGHCSVFCGMGHGSMTLKLHVVD